MKFIISDKTGNMDVVRTCYICETEEELNNTINCLLIEENLKAEDLEIHLLSGTYGVEHFFRNSSNHLN